MCDEGLTDVTFHSLGPFIGNPSTASTVSSLIPAVIYHNPKEKYLTLPFSFFSLLHPYLHIKIPFKCLSYNKINYELKMYSLQ